jgi:dTDP-4-amino-4,6-dideoxygalactose transaminase
LNVKTKTGGVLIPLVDLVTQYKTIQPEIDAAVQRVLLSGQFILGEEVNALEEEVAAFLGVRHAIGVASGTDALLIALRACGIHPGDEVLLPAYTFFASASTILLAGAKPVFVDIDPHTYCLDPNQVERCISPRSRAIMPVHLYGQPADMDALSTLAARYSLTIIEDNAQAFGAEYHGCKTAGLGEAGCLSFFPTKNLGGYGDGGMLVTNNDDVAERARQLHTHGWKRKYFPETLGYNSRLDALQAAILRAKLPHVTTWNERRRLLSQRYNHGLAGLELGLPEEAPGTYHVYHLYVIRSAQRDHLQSALKKAGIASDVYYPLPPYLAEPCRSLGYRPGDFPAADQASRETLALPLYPELTFEQQDTIIETIATVLL